MRNTILKRKMILYGIFIFLVIITVVILYERLKKPIIEHPNGFIPEKNLNNGTKLNETHERILYSF